MQSKSNMLWRSQCCSNDMERKS